LLENDSIPDERREADDPANGILKLPDIVAADNIIEETTHELSFSLQNSTIFTNRH
jgi:hypothetical protein